MVPILYQYGTTRQAFGLEVPFFGLYLLKGSDLALNVTCAVSLWAIF